MAQELAEGGERCRRACLRHVGIQYCVGRPGVRVFAPLLRFTIPLAAAGTIILRLETGLCATPVGALPDAFYCWRVKAR